MNNPMLQSGKQGAIRSALSESFDESGGNAISTALALSAHPWPDRQVPAEVLTAIAGELLPATNLPHPNQYEIAIDRLLRFAEVTRFAGENELCSEFFSAALAIEESLSVNNRSIGLPNADPAKAAPLDFILNPLGICGARQNDSCELSNLHREMGDALSDGVAQLFGASVARNSSDIGELVGGAPAALTVSQLADVLNIQSPFTIFDQFIDELSSRDRDIFVSRTFTLRIPKTLDEISERWCISRERVRQRENVVTEKFGSLFKNKLERTAQAIVEKLECRVCRLVELHGLGLRIAEKSRWRETLAAAVIGSVGPWKNVGDWAFHEMLAERVDSLGDAAKTLANEYGIVEEGDLDSLCSGLFHNNQERNNYLIGSLGLGFNFGVWTLKNTTGYQVKAALWHLKSSSTKEEIAALISLPVSNVGALLGNLRGIVRADKYRWGFDIWVEDPYDGIVGEIRQRIDDAGGSVPVDLLLNEIPTLFGVSEGSVQAYLSTDAFAVENYVVRHAEQNEFSPREPSTCPGAIRVNGKWGQRIRIFERHFAGYSLGVSFDIAFANGLRPNDDLLVPVNGTADQASVIWRPHTITRRIDVGRLSGYLTSHGCACEEDVVVIPSRDIVEVIRAADLPSSDLGLDAAVADYDIVHDPLFDLLGEDQ